MTNQDKTTAETVERAKEVVALCILQAKRIEELELALKTLTDDQ